MKGRRWWWSKGVGVWLVVLLQAALVVQSANPSRQGWWTRAEARAERGVQWRESTLFFGLSLQTNSDDNGTWADSDKEISDADFTRFVASVVTPLFPDGLTILDAHGQYLNHHGVLVREKSKYLIIFHPDESAYHDKLERIWRNYTSQFQQESILLTSTITDFCFNDECLGTPIPDLQAEFESLQAKYASTAALLGDMEARLAVLEDDRSLRWWWYAGAGVVVVAGVSGLLASVAVAMLHRLAAEIQTQTQTKPQ